MSGSSPGRKVVGKGELAGIWRERRTRDGFHHTLRHTRGYAFAYWNRVPPGCQRAPFGRAEWQGGGAWARAMGRKRGLSSTRACGGTHELNGLATMNPGPKGTRVKHVPAWCSPALPKAVVTSTARAGVSGLARGPGPMAHYQVR